MASTGQDFKNYFRLADPPERLIIVNVVIFLLIRLTNAISTLFLQPIFSFEDISHSLALPAHLSSLFTHPWTLITYMFLHWDISHILFNMLWLYWMGKILTEFLGKKKIVGIYILGGLAGALFFIIAFNIFPLFTTNGIGSFALGASASVLAITTAAATLVPDYSIHLLFFGAVRLKYIAWFSILLDLISISSTNAGGHIAHLGGALFGFLYIKQLRRGKDMAQWINRLFDGSSKKSRMRTSFTNARQFTREENFNTRKKEQQERMDEILDKISRSGYGSLTKEEKEFLFKISKE